MGTDQTARTAERALRAVEAAVRAGTQAGPSALAARLLEALLSALGADGGALMLIGLAHITGAGNAVAVIGIAGAGCKGGAASHN